MGFLALLAAAAALASLAVAGVGKFAAVGLGILALGLGWIGYRARGGRPAARLAGAAGMAVAACAVALAGLKIGLTLVVIERIAGTFR